MNGTTIDRRAMKLDARAAMREHRPSIYLIALVFLAIMLVLELLNTRLEFPGASLQDIALGMYDDAAFERIMTAAIDNRTPAGTLLSYAISVMELFLSGGMVMVTLKVARREEAGFGMLFEMFSWFFRYLWLCILTAIFIFLWSLLLIVPGIIAAYRYSMAIYIFCDDPEKSALQCIRESKAMTQGFKGQIFVMELSFIGWLLLTAIPFVSVFVMPYVLVTMANYYRALRGEFNEPKQPLPPDGGAWGQGST